MNDQIEFRSLAIKMAARLLGTLILIGATSFLLIAQTKPTTEPLSELCTRDNAVETTKQQLLSTRTFDNPVQRIAVVIRYADLMWPHQREQARAAFLEAFDFAVQNFKETGDKVLRTSSSQFAAVIPIPDQRYKVIAAYAKRDPAAARKLSEQMLQNDLKEAEDKPAVDLQAKRKTAEKLLVLAHGLLATDLGSALAFARASFQYPAVLQLPIFLYELAKTNKTAADLFYQEALTVYGPTPMEQFLYLSSYPFGNTREAGEMPGYTFYKIPEGFTPNVNLQRAFVQRLLGRVEATLQTPVVESTATGRYSDSSNMWLALSRLEKQIAANLPELIDASAQSKDKLFALLNPTIQKRVGGTLSSDNPPKRSLDEQVEAALKDTNVDRRDQLLTFAVLGSAREADVDKVISVVEKISDDKVRPALLNWFYFFRTQSYIAEKRLDEARTLATKVTELDQRAYLFTRIAEESLKQSEDQTQARELLNEVAIAVAKAPKTMVSARALLALAYLYAKIDVNRGVEELGNAVKTINALEAPDFSSQSVMMKIEGKTFGSFAAYATPGFNPENAFREMGKLDFDGSLSQASTFSDKSLRSLTTLAVIEPCLLIVPKTKPGKTPAKP
jgi:hypothetical protein